MVSVMMIMIITERSISPDYSSERSSIVSMSALCYNVFVKIIKQKSMHILMM